MTSNKRRTRQKGAKAGKAKSRKRAAGKAVATPGIGHNKPPPEVPPAPPPMGWFMDDQSAAQFAHAKRVRQQRFIAATNSG